MNTAQITKIGHNARNPIDHLGAVKAQIADLEAEAKPLIEEIKGMGAGTHAGQLFDANVAEVGESESFDAGAMEAKLREMGVDNRWFNKNKKIKAGYLRLSVKARK
jgi:hypothetical protein